MDVKRGVSVWWIFNTWVSLGLFCISFAIHVLLFCEGFMHQFGGKVPRQDHYIWCNAIAQECNNKKTTNDIFRPTTLHNYDL